MSRPAYDASPRDQSSASRGEFVFPGFPLLPSSCARPGSPASLVLIVALFLGLALFFEAQAEERKVQENGKPMAAVIVAGVINYTRWPRLGEAIRICFAGKSAHAEEIRQLSPVTQKMKGSPSTFLVLSQEGEVARDCDLVYVGDLPDEEVRTLLKATGNTAILTIGEGKEFCSLGGMFCLEAEPKANSVGFAANLDAISRSQLRVNPQVLRLSSRLRQTPP
ncbi:MAG: YfiR family protein [Zoogloeaceae bacterium]|nr:YfiR family protein [Zoogloeaceae bacterium]